MMNGRGLVRVLTCGLLASVANFIATPMASDVFAGSATIAQDRTVTDLTRGWRFRFEGDSSGVTDSRYDDSTWQQVEIPHTWNRLGEYHLAPSSQTNNSHGVGWYRLGFSTPEKAFGRRQFLQFDAVGNVADVWLNGVHLGQHPGAFSRFRFDVTEQLKPGAGNVLVVKADNSKPAPGASTENVIPLDADFFVHGGIYRNVSLIDTNSAHIDLLDHGGPGVYFSTPVIDAENVDVAVLVRLTNAGADARVLSLKTTIHDADGVAIASDTVPTKLGKAAVTEVRRTLVLGHPRLWRGREDPYLYSVSVELIDHGTLIDRVVQPLGVRSFHFDPDAGFFLNGKSTPLHGASRHQDRLDKGWALSPQDHAEDMAIMAEMGVNTIRQAHYQHAQEWSDAADKAGMVVWAEIPFVDQPSLTNDAPAPALIDNAKAQLIELIRQNYNHPSIMLWSVGNEADLKSSPWGFDKPTQSLDLLKSLNVLAKHEDPTRVTAYAVCCEDVPDIRGPLQILSNIADVTGYNLYFGWYRGAPAQVGSELDKFHARYPKMPVAVSEYGAGGALSQHTDNPRGGPIDAHGRPHPEEYESWVHEIAWGELKSRRYLAAIWIWNMFDFASDTREEGDAIYLNDKGMVSFDRKQKKDVFFFYKANWSTEPVLHITGKRYINRAYPVVDVRVYSNAERAVLSVGGEVRGEVPCPDRICIWRDVALQPGNNIVRVTASIDGKSLVDSVDWIAPSAAAGIRILAGTLAGLTTADGRRFGSDNFFVGGAGKALNPEHGAKAKIELRRVTGAADPALYEAYREGAFKYEIPLPDGNWQVTLHFFDGDPALAAKRTFSVIADGKTLLRSFNPANTAGGALKAVQRHFPVIVRNGRLILDFVPGDGPAIVSAIEVTRG